MVLPFITPALRAFPDSTEAEPDAGHIFFIGHLNFDDVPDTLKGYVSSDVQFIPSMICWGSTDTTANRRKKTGSQTSIKLPKWEKMIVSCAVEDVNLDTVPDIIFYLRGISDDATNTRKQFRALVLFGQNGLDSIKKINLGSITEGFQQTPFFAMDLRKGTELDRAAKRDPSRKESYLLRKVYRNVHRDSTQDSSRTIRHDDITAGIEQPLVSIFPNPAAQSTNLQISRIQPGEYQVQIFSVNGMRYHQQTITVDENGEVLRLLSIRDVPTGYYVVQLFSEERLIGSYPVVVLQ
jgi:hypothetical protein